MSEPNLNPGIFDDFIAACERLHKTVETKVKPALQKLKKIDIGDTIILSQLEAMGPEDDDTFVTVERVIYYQGSAKAVKKVLNYRNLRGELVVRNPEPGKDVKVWTIE